MAPKTKLVAFHPVHGYKIKPQQDLKTIKRNERERKRVETVNRGFETLRRHVPTAAMVKKMSKVNILSQAVDYIQHLQQILESSSQPQQSPWSSSCLQTSQYSHSPIPYHTQTNHCSPGTFSDSSSQGYFSDSSSLHSPHWQVSPYVSAPQYSSYHIKQELPDSTSQESSGEEDDVLDAIAEWQQM